MAQLKYVWHLHSCIGAALLALPGTPGKTATPYHHDMLQSCFDHFVKLPPCRDRQDRYSAPARGDGSTRDAAAAAALPQPISRAALLAAAAAAPPLPLRPDNTLGAPPNSRSVSGRCINVSDSALARECISKMCLVAAFADDVRFESDKER
jgi:hypothetical protein